ncbi:MAG: DUF58 domain-containing protein [Bacteroidales bacterium]|nr:DUF58 domain-containing protein [Bacteroidales bacterium]
MINDKYLHRLEQVHHFDHLEIIARFVVEGFITGLHKSPYHGFSVEFAEHRQYNNGESTRHVDWKLFARTDRLYVKKYEEETNLRSYIAIDTSTSMLFPYQSVEKVSKLAFSVISAAGLIHLLRNQRDAVGLMLFNEKADILTQARISQMHAQYLFGQLENLLKKYDATQSKKSNIADSLHFLAENAHKRSLVIVFSDMFADNPSEELFAALQHLRYRKHEVILFHVTDHQYELNFEYHNRPYKFVDLETQSERKLNPNEIRQAYQQLTIHNINTMKEKCAQYQIDFVQADINLDFSQVLLPYLIKRKNMF